MFVLHDKVVYPGHGAAKISRIIEKKVMGVETTFFELEFVNKDMTILIPVHSISTVGIRKLSSPDNIKAIFKMLSEPSTKMHCELNASNWNKRNKEYQCKIRTGNINEIGKIYRDLRYISTYKELSFGEKNLLHQTEGLLVEEISLVTQMPTEQAIEHVRLLCKNNESMVPLMVSPSSHVMSA
jgi:CarD family transcriptional regulator